MRKKPPNEVFRERKNEKKPQSEVFRERRNEKTNPQRVKIHKLGGEGSAPKAAGFLYVGASWTPACAEKKPGKKWGVTRRQKNPLG